MVYNPGGGAGCRRRQRRATPDRPSQLRWKLLSAVSKIKQRWELEFGVKNIISLRWELEFAVKNIMFVVKNIIQLR